MATVISGRTFAWKATPNQLPPNRPFYGLTGVNSLIEHDQWPGVDAAIPIAKIRLLINQAVDTPVSEIEHPFYTADKDNWDKWSLIYESGEAFIEAYTEKFSRRESPKDFEKRKRVTPTPSFAKTSVIEIKNSIFQRMADVTRIGGPQSYQQACQALLGGVDRKGGSMTWYIGNQILPELLVKRKVGVFVDNEILGPTLADRGNKHPYLYRYKAEDIKSWNEAPTGSGVEFTEILLREYVYTSYQGFDLPSGTKEIFRRVFLKSTNGSPATVHMQFYDDQNASIGQEIVLNIRKIPFKVFEISDSLLKDVANHQIALLNLESSDMSYALLGNFPLYVEQFDPKSDNQYLKTAQRDWNQFSTNTTNTPAGEVCPPEQPTADREISAGSTQGRRYPIGANSPGFIAPPSEPLMASMEKQDRLKTDIRSLVHLALSNLQPKIASAESKKMDQSGLEAGLSYIGLELEAGERALGEFWSMYENTSELPKVNYPKLWSLKTDEEIQKEVEKLEETRDSLPSRTFQKEVSKQMARKMLAMKVPDSVIETILKEIDEADSITSDPATILEDFKAGIIPGDLATKARGYPEGTYGKAKQDRVDRAAEIAKAQGLKQGAAAGVPELDANPASGQLEKTGLPIKGQSNA